MWPFSLVDTHWSRAWCCSVSNYRPDVGNHLCLHKDRFRQLSARALFLTIQYRFLYIQNLQYIYAIISANPPPLHQHRPGTTARNLWHFVWWARCAEEGNIVRPVRTPGSGCCCCCCCCAAIDSSPPPPNLAWRNGTGVGSYSARGFSTRFMKLGCNLLLTL